MHSELPQMLREAAPAPRARLDPDELWARGRRRLHRRRFAAGGAAVALVGLAAAGTAWLGRPGSDDVVVTAGEVVAYEDEVRSFSVRYPSAWRRATDVLTPGLSDPTEILSLGTAELPAGGEACAQFPVEAIAAMGPEDAFITVQETYPGGGSRFPPRPEVLPPAGSRNMTELPDCLSQPVEFDHWWFNFEDSGRGFYVLVAVGVAASEQTRAEAWDIVKSLDFELDPSPADRVLIDRLIGFARSHDPADLPPLAERVRLGLGRELLVERSASDLHDPASWVLLSEPFFRGYEGPFSPLDPLADAEGVEVVVGPHPHCASPAEPAPDEVANLRRVSVQPTGIDTCLLWFTVDLFLAGDGSVRAVTLDLWEP